METDRTPREQFTTDGLRLLESAVEQASEAVLITTAQLDPPGPEIIFINQAFTRMTGYSAEEVIGRTPRILQGPKTERAVLDKLRDSLSRGEAFSGEAINYRKDGSEYHVAWRIAPVRDRDGVVTHFISIQSDVIARKRAEEALRASGRTLRELVDALPAAVYVCDASGAIESYNRRAAELWGREPSVGDAADVFCGSYKIYTPDGTYLSHDECPMARVLRSGVAVYDEEIVVERPDGSRRTAVVNIIPRRDERGNLTGAINCMTDITERKRAEAELRRSEERYRAILRAIPDLMFLLNEDGVYLDYYAKDEHELAAPPEVFLGKNMREVLPAALCTTVSASIRRAREKDEPQIVEFALNVGREERQYEARIVHSGGDTFLTMVRNITERKRAEKEMSRLLRRLVTTEEEERRRIARELHDQLGRYPTALMLGLKALGDAGGAPPADGDRVQQLMSLADQLGHEIHRLAWELRPSSLDDLELHTSVSNYLEEWSGRSGITADFHSNGLLGRRLPPQVETAAYRIVQEALTNVLKHAEARRVTVVLKYRHERLLAIVEDDGRGFDAEEVLKASGPRRRLGLLGMQERARLVNGELEIESAPGAGTTLYVRIPVPAEHEEEGDDD